MPDLDSLLTKSFPLIQIQNYHLINFLTAKVSSSTRAYLGLSVCLSVYKVEIYLLKVH